MRKIAFFAGPAWEKWDASSPTSRGIGGSETCLVYLSKELVRLGYDVSLFIDTSEAKEHEGVRYYPFEEFARFRGEPYDFLIHFRSTRAMELMPLAKCQIGFAQDITLSVKTPVSDLVNRLDYLFSLSEAHTLHMSQYHGFPIDRIRMTANAVDPGKYPGPLTPELKAAKVRNQVFYSSCPSRDLDLLLRYSEDIAAQVEDFQLVVGYGFQTWEGMLRRGIGDYRKYFFTQDMLKRLPWVKYVGRVDQNTLAKIQLESRAWLYPTRFPETFCITAAEAGMAHCPIVTSTAFGLPTTVKDAGILIDGDPESPEFRQAFVTAAVRVLKDEALWEQAAQRGYERMKRFTWENVARQWHQFFESGRWTIIQ